MYFFFVEIDDSVATTAATPKRKPSKSVSPSSAVAGASAKRDQLKFKTLDDVAQMAPFDSTMNILQYSVTNKKTTKMLSGILELDGSNSAIILNQTIKGHERETIVSRLNQIVNQENIRLTIVDNLLFSTSVHNESAAIVVKIVFHRKAIVHKGTQLVKLVMVPSTPAPTPPPAVPISHETNLC